MKLSCIVRQIGSKTVGVDLLIGLTVILTMWSGPFSVSKDKRKKNGTYQKVLRKLFLLNWDITKLKFKTNPFDYLYYWGILARFLTLKGPNCK